MTALQEATVFVKYVNEPRGNAKSASIKDASGNYWGIPQNMMASFTPGQSYLVKFDVTTGRDGRGYKNIKSATPAGGNGVGPAPTPQKSAGNYGPTDQGTAERIYVCGILNAAVRGGACTTDVEDLVRVTDAARAAYKATFGA